MTTLADDAGGRVYPDNPLQNRGTHFTTAFIIGWNDRCQPFIWAKTAGQIRDKANRPKNSTTRH